MSLFNTIVSAGCIQASIAAIWIKGDGAKNATTNLLSAVLLMLALLSLKILLHTLGWWNIPVVRYLPLAPDILMPPLFYLYCRSLTHTRFTLTKYQWLHLLIPAFLFLYVIVVYLAVLGTDNIAEKDNIADRLAYTRVKWIEDILTMVFAVVYWYLSFVEIRRYRHWLFSNEPATQYQELTWLRNLLISAAALIVLLFVSSLSANVLFSKNSFNYLVFFYTYLTILIYFLSFRGYSIIWSNFSVNRMDGPSPVVSSREETNKELEQRPDTSQLYQQVVARMKEQKPYLDPNLNLSKLAEIMNTPAAQVSAAINNNSNQNFRNWVNSYRVEEVKKRLADPRYAHLNMTGIAYDAGFNSEASFYRIFRQLTGHSPKSYLDSLKNKS